MHIENAVIIVDDTDARHEPYGQVAVFLDVAGNRWNLLGPPIGVDQDGH